MVSGFVLTFQRDHRPPDLPATNRMLDRIAHRGMDGCDIVQTGPVILGHQHLWTTPEEVGERQPLLDASGQLSLVFCGRLDNRRDLLHALEHDDTGRHISDAGLVLLAYQRWAEACLAHLLGPFALAVYDARRRRVLCARDALGDHTLFYHLSSHLFIVASEEQAVLAHPGVSRRLNEQRLALYFAIQELVDGATFFAEVSELLPAHLMIVEESRLQIHRYWDIAPAKRIRYRTDAEYAEHFRSVLEQSVACRLRTISPPAVMMSGGLDSTSIAAVAARQLSSLSPASPLRSLSYVFDELKSCDERWFMQALIQQYGLDAVQIPSDAGWPLSDPETWPCNPNSPENDVYRRLPERIYQAAQARGHRTVLTGMFADHLYAGSAHWLRDLLHDKRFGQAGRESCWHGRRPSQRSWLLSGLLRCSPGWQDLQRLWTRRRPVWLTEYAQALLPADRPWPPSARAAARPEQHRAVLGLLAAHGLSFERFYTSQYGLELRYPYRDRRMIEFFLAVPAHQLYRCGLEKPVLRNTMHGILPERIRRRRHPTGLQALFLRGVAEKEWRTVRQILSRPNRLWPEYIREDWLAEVNPARLRSEEEGLVLWLCVCYELWHLRFGGNVLAL